MSDEQDKDNHEASEKMANHQAIDRIYKALPWLRNFNQQHDTKRLQVLQSTLEFMGSASLLGSAELMAEGLCHVHVASLLLMGAKGGKMLTEVLNKFANAAEDGTYPFTPGASLIELADLLSRPVDIPQCRVVGEYTVSGTEHSVAVLALGRSEDHPGFAGIDPGQ